MKKEIEELNNKIESTYKKVQRNIVKLGKENGDLYNSLVDIENCFNLIKGLPSKEKQIFETAIKTRLNWEKSVREIDKALKTKSAQTAGFGAAGVGAGVAVAALGPSVAMGIATTFGVASTGTAISALSGAAATNAALAWLGGGALAAGGAGMAGGKFLLALAGPVGWAIAGISLAVSGVFLFLTLKDKKRIEELIILIGNDQLKRFELANVELNERMRIINSEVKNIKQAVVDIKRFGIDYDLMNEQQKYRLGTYVNLMYASSQLLIKPIDSLIPRFTDKDFSSFLKYYKNNIEYQLCKDNKDLIIYFANQYYGIQMNNDDYKLMWKANRASKELLQKFNISKQDFVESLFWIVRDALYFARGY